MKMRTLLVLSGVAALAAGCDGNHAGNHDHAKMHATPSSHVTGPQARVTKAGTPVKLTGNALRVGDKAPDAKLVTCDMDDLSVSDLRGRIVVLSIAPSLDTAVCNSQTLRFDELAPTFGSDVVVVSASADLPSALSRWQGERGTEQITLASDYHYEEFGRQYGLLMPDSSLLARAALVIDRDGVIRHIEVVGDLTREPDYRAVIETIEQLRQG
jgi:thiol peroxidase